MNAFDIIAGAAPPPDTTSQTVTITVPANGAIVLGTITILADASDNVGVAGVQFLLDGAPLGAEDTTAPYAVTWDTTTVASGPHTLTAVTRDAAGNEATADPVTVIGANLPGVGALPYPGLFMKVRRDTAQTPAKRALEAAKEGDVLSAVR